MRAVERARERAAAGALARADGFAVRFPLEPIICAACLTSRVLSQSDSVEWAARCEPSKGVEFFA